MKKIVSRCWMLISANKKTQDEKMRELGFEMANDLCNSYLKNKKLSSQDVELVFTSFKDALLTNLTERIIKNQEEKKLSIAYFENEINQAENAIKKINKNG